MKVVDKIKKYGQEQLLRFEKELSEEQKEKLYSQISELDFSYLDALKSEQTNNNCEITPIKAMTINEIKINKEKYEEFGIKVLQNYEVGVLLLAGGMGTRLGSDNPKGLYNIGKTKDIFIFQRLFENLLEVVNKCGKFIPFFIMTSDKNHKTTTEFLKEKNYFGYDKNFIKFFIQEKAPCVDLNGKILLEEKDRVATSPNGNGGWFNSLLNNVEAKEMFEKYNIKWLNVVSVDNVLQKIADPVFIGATIEGQYEVGSKVIKKVDAFEKVGVMCNKNERPSIVEYIDLTEEMAVEIDENGERVYNFGIVLNYLFKVDTLYKIKDNKLPVHIVTKKIEYIDNDGKLIKPNEPNAHKFELLCADMIEYCNSCLPFEVERCKEFAPVKNKTGVDSVESAQALLEQNGYNL